MWTYINEIKRLLKDVGVFISFWEQLQFRGESWSLMSHSKLFQLYGSSHFRSDERNWSDWRKATDPQQANWRTFLHNEIVIWTLEISSLSQLYKGNVNVWWLYALSKNYLPYVLCCHVSLSDFMRKCIGNFDNEVCQRTCNKCIPTWDNVLCTKLKDVLVTGQGNMPNSPKCHCFLPHASSSDFVRKCNGHIDVIVIA